MNKDLQSLSEVQEVIENDLALITYFYSDNCAPCKSLRPKVLDLISKQYPKMNLYFINAEKNPEISAKYAVFSNPTLLVFFDRKEYLRKSKYISISELSQSVDRLYTMMFD